MLRKKRRDFAFDKITQYEKRKEKKKNNSLHSNNIKITNVYANAIVYFH